MAMMSPSYEIKSIVLNGMRTQHPLQAEGIRPQGIVTIFKNSGATSATPVSSLLDRLLGNWSPFHFVPDLHMHGFLEGDRPHDKGHRGHGHRVPQAGVNIARRGTNGETYERH